MMFTEAEQLSLSRARKAVRMSLQMALTNFLTMMKSLLLRML
jgi:hypothetical protein